MTQCSFPFVYFCVAPWPKTLEERRNFADLYHKESLWVFFASTRLCVSFLGLLFISAMQKENPNGQNEIDLRFVIPSSRPCHLGAKLAAMARFASGRSCARILRACGLAG